MKIRQPNQYTKLNKRITSLENCAFYIFLMYAIPISFLMYEVLNTKKVYISPDQSAIEGICQDLASECKWQASHGLIATDMETGEVSGSPIDIERLVKCSEIEARCIKNVTQAFTLKEETRQ